MIAGDGKRNWIIDLSHALPSSEFGQCSATKFHHHKTREKERNSRKVHLPRSKQIIIIKEIRNVCISARARATGSKGFVFATWKQIFLPVSRHKKSFYSPRRISRKLFSRVLSGSDDLFCEWNGRCYGTSIDKLAHSSIILQFYTWICVIQSCFYWPRETETCIADIDRLCRVSGYLVTLGTLSGRRVADWETVKWLEISPAVTWNNLPRNCLRQTVQ